MVTQQLELLKDNLKEVNVFFDKLMVADGGQENAWVVANAASAVSAANAVEELNTLTNTVFKMVGRKADASDVQEASSSSQGGRLLLRRRWRDHRR